MKRLEVYGAIVAAVITTMLAVHLVYATNIRVDSIIDLIVSRFDSIEANQRTMLEILNGK